MQKSNNKIADYLVGLNSDDTVRFRDNTLWLIYHDIEFDPVGMNDLQFGAFQYGLYQRDHIPYLLISFQDFMVDLHINAYEVITSDQRRRFGGYEGKACFMLVSPESSQILAMRHFHFNPHCVDQLKSCIQRQWKYYHSEVEVNKKISELSEFLVTEEMFSCCKSYKSPAQKSR